MSAAIPKVSQRRVCRILAVPRSGVRRGSSRLPRRSVLNDALAARIADLMRRYPTSGIGGFGRCCAFGREPA